VTVRRLLAVVVIFLGCTAAWFLLGSSVVSRTGQFDDHLGREVTLLWGAPHTQMAPQAWVARPREVTDTIVEVKDGQTVSRKVTKTVTDWAAAPMVSTRADANLHLAHRQKGLLWYDTYEVAFRSTYLFDNPDDIERDLRLKFAFPAEHAIYDDFTLTIDGVAATRTGDLSKAIETIATIKPRARIAVAVGYRSRGIGEWRYGFAESGVVEVRDFLLTLQTNFGAIDFPAGTMSPTEKAAQGDGWRLSWRFANLVTGQAVGVDLPNRLNPGPLASRIIFFAPVSLLFFLTVMVILDVLSGESLHPMNYFFISAAFFAFHLLLAYLVDHISIHLAFAIAAAVSVALVASYLRVVVGVSRRLWPAAIAQAIYLVAFSYAFFFEGLTGLTVTVGAVVTLCVLMQTTAKVRWADVFAEAPVNARPAR
jgi:hypothetical protein